MSTSSPSRRSAEEAAIRRVVEMQSSSHRGEPSSALGHDAEDVKVRGEERLAIEFRRETSRHVSVPGLPPRTEPENVSTPWPYVRPVAQLMT